jgi:hypothetical protein
MQIEVFGGIKGFLSHTWRVRDCTTSMQIEVFGAESAGTVARYTL